MPDMMKKYKDEVRPALQASLGLSNVMEIPKLTKIVISTGVKSSAERDAFTEAKKQIAALAGQQPVITKARKNVANFKLRVGMSNGVMVTLRGTRMYEFLDRFVHNAMPRVRDFRGISDKGFDGRGNYNVGVPDVSVFTEIDTDKLKYPLGINITIVTTAKTDEAARELLKMMEIPFTTGKQA
ncbi:MAG: 50S ribosomal protein L5 [Victivallaceae bacterium]|nr:50S ribosomal protein L5 [Victivallaceae bacterium]